MPIPIFSSSVSHGSFTRLADRYGVPVEDVLLIAVNIYGIASSRNQHRARVTLRLASAPAVPWMVIVPLNAATSPFVLEGDSLLLGRVEIGVVSRIDADEAVGGYFRDGGRAATLNTNARSRCVGCAFCPNTLEAAADPRLSEQRELDDLLVAMAEQHPLRSLRSLREVTVSTGCFEREAAAVAHLVMLRETLARHDITARIGFLTSVVRSDEAFDLIASVVGPFVLRLTIECFSRRDLLLKASKAQLRPNEMLDLLERAQRLGLGTSFTYVVGLDPYDDLCAGVTSLAERVTEFPNFQVYQAHNSIMDGLRAPDVEPLEFCLKARRAIEKIIGPTGTRPAPWECYRPLWYFTFAGERLVAA